MDIIKSIDIVLSKEFCELIDGLDDLCRIEDEDERLEKGCQFAAEYAAKEEAPRLIRKVLLTCLISALRKKTLEERCETLVLTSLDYIKDYIDENPGVDDKVLNYLRERVTVKEEDTSRVINCPPNLF